MATPHPGKNWSKGFPPEYRIGAGETETPFLRNGAWYLRVWNTETRKHEEYCYDTDTFEPDPVRQCPVFGCPCTGPHVHRDRFGMVTIEVR